jgi:molecular chaperone DnaJ
MSKDYYNVLGVDKSATKADIKKAYKKLAKKYHPDISQEADAETKFKEINEAAAVLGDDQKRAQYDQYGAEGMKYSNNMGGFDFSDFMRGGGFDFDDIFDSFFGGGNRGDIFGRGGRSRQNRGRNLRFDIEIDLKEAAFGVTKTIVIPKLEKCSKCNGKGAVSDSDIKTCGTCHGTGMVKETKRTPFGIFATSRQCNVCGGVGKEIKNPCPVCDGDGREKKNKKIKIKIPAGVETGMRLQVQNEGEAGEFNGPSGDLFVMIHVQEHEIFERRGNDIVLELPVRFAQVALGDEVEVPTLKDTVKMKIPAGTQSNTIFKLKGKGIPYLNSYGQGDQLVRVIVEVPTKLSKKEKDLLKEFDGEIKDKKKGFFGF